MKLFLLFIYLLHGINCLETNSELMKYLDDRAKIVGEKLIRHGRNSKNLYTVKFNDVNKMKLIGNYSSGKIFTFFNTSYALMDRELYQISPSNYSLVETFLFNENVVLFKTTEFRNVGFLMFATTSNILHIFGFHKDNQKIFKIQNIVHVNVTDAAFFTCQDGLYLIVSSYKSPDLTSIVLYKFIHSHFDETETFMTSGATKLHTFANNDGSQIILILQKFGVTSSLYEFKDDKIRKIHKIDTQNPNDALNYIHLEKRYVLLFSGTDDVSLYLWTGSDLLLLEEFKSETSIAGTKSIFYVENNPYLIATNKSSFVIFSLVNQFMLLQDSRFNTNWTNIWTFTINQKNELVGLGPKTKNSVEISNFSISIEAKVLEKVVEKEKLVSCFLTLEKSVYALRNKLTIAENNTAEILREAADNPSQERLLLEKLKKLQVKYLTMKATIEDRKSNKLVINNTASVDLPAGAKKVIAKNLRFDIVNNQKWKPDKWLSYTSPQTISGTVKTNLLEVDRLQTNESDPLFKDFLLSKGKQIISGSIRVKNLEATDVETKLLNNISVDKLYYKSRPVVIQGVKSFPQLEAQNIETANINGREGNELETLLVHLNMSEFSTNLTVNNLWVDEINGIDFDKFKNSVFRIGEDTIDGNLAIASVRAKNMTFDTLSKVSSVLTTSTDQTITSSLWIRSIYATNVKTNKINGMKFKNSVATLDKPINVVHGPVSIRRLNVKNNLELKGDIDDEFLLLNKTHVVGTNDSDFLQRYTKNVKIKGNLYVKNFDLGKDARIFIADQEFDPKIDQFWTKSTQQTIPTHFEAERGMSTPHLYTSLINDVDVNDYLLNSTQQKKAAKFYFDNVTIKGNVFLNPDEQHTPDLARIQQDSAKINGTFKIKGRKTYTNILKVDRLEVNRISGSGVPDDFSKETDLANTVQKTIRHLIVKGNLKSKKIYVEEINDTNLEKLVETTVYIDRPQNMSYLAFESAAARKISVTSTLNGNNMQELNEKFDLNKIDRITNVYCNDNVTIKNVKQLSTINNQEVAQLLRKSLSQYKNQTIFGNVKFRGTTKVKDLYVVVVNDVDLQELSTKILYKLWNQTIKGHFTFTKLTVNNLIADQINDFNVTNLIDVAKTEPQEFFATGGLKMTKPVKVKNLNGQFSCDITESLLNLRNPPSQFWSNIIVTGNVTFMDKQSLISRIFDEVVTSKDTNQIIRGKVNFINHISANNVTALKTINDIDIMEIISDAVLNQPDVEQVIKGKKQFVKLEAEEVVSLQNTNVFRINDIDIAEVDSKIISKNSILDVPIKGQKVFFGGLQTKQIETDFISGLETKNLVSFEQSDKIPSAMFESVSVVNNFNIKFINEMPFEVLLNERLLRESSKQVVTGNYFFQDVTFSENIVTPHINDIKMENVIYDGDVQTISSLKTFANDLKINGNARIELINGLKLAESYEKAVLKNEETNFTGLVHLLKPTLVEGNITTKYINGVRVEYMIETNTEQSLQVEAHQIQEITEKISNLIHQYLNTTIKMPTEIMYVEKSEELQISFANTVSAHIVETKDDILIHVESEEDGGFCGLPQTCKCPMQQTMQISSEHSINVFMNKATQRIYSYYHDDIIIHLITHSISSSNYCRTSKTKVMNEISTLTWNVPPQKNTTGGFFIHRAFFNGFISGVEFFTIYERTYIVIGNYYDPVLDTHNVDTLVLRLNEEKTALEEIQKIPTFGTKTISLFPTAQGIILILGSDIADEFNNTNTEILRFNRERQQFELLRKVPTFRSLFAEGIVLEIDSLIILADKRSHLLVLKYQPEFDNYYLYQSFQLDYTVSSMSVFYAEGFGISDAYLSVVTTNDQYFIYSFRFIEGWKYEFSGKLDGTKILVPFKLNKKSYLFAPSNKVSSLLTLVEHDSD